MPFFSVIIPTYNRQDRISLTIDSVLSQTYDDYEIIVINDGSTDNTYNVLQQYEDKIISIYQKNEGVSSARNKGIAISKGKYVAFLDDDDIWGKNKLQKHFDFISNHPEIEIHQSDETWIRNGKHFNKKKIHQKLSGNIFKESLNMCLISPSAVVIKKNIFTKYGLFDQLLPACEDYDLWLRISLHNKIGLINEELLKKNGGHGDQLSQKYWGMDRFRIYSILNLLLDDKFENHEKDKELAKNIVMQKIEILINGSKKRNKKEYILKLSELKEKVNFANYSKKDFLFLLE